MGFNKNYLSGLFFCLLIIICSCKKQDTPIIVEPVEEITEVYEAGDTSLGFAQALKNGLPFEASGWASKHICPSGEEKVRILLFTYDRGYWREDFNLAPVNLKDSLYILPVNSCGGIQKGGYVTVSNEQIEDEYLLSDNQNNWLKVTYIDTIAKIIRGEFNIEYEVVLPKSYPSVPSVVAFTNGTFDFTIVE